MARREPTAVWLGVGSGYGAGCRQNKPDTVTFRETGCGEPKRVGGRSVAVIAVAQAGGCGWACALRERSKRVRLRVSCELWQGQGLRCSTQHARGAAQTVTECG